jgi:2-polyprenyl-3-methyl-5-hydroxy-6-metoxy-1,4-benzoquinol methylase
MSTVSNVSAAWTELETLGACPVCGANQHKEEFPTDVRRCLRCKVLFRSPRPSQAAIKASYDRGLNYQRWQEEESARDAMWGVRLDLIARHKPGRRLLDIGTGDGRFLIAASRAGFVIDATELSDTGIQYAATRGFAVRKGQVTEIDFGECKYDLITIWHVMEHVPNPREVLMNCRRLLAPGGILVVAVPNEDCLLYRHALRKLLHRSPKRNPLGDIPYGGEVHLTHFQPSTLRRFISAGGFDLLDFGVDDVFVSRDAKTLRHLRFHRLLSRMTGWHASNAMYVIARLS